MPRLLQFPGPTLRGARKRRGKLLNRIVHRFSKWRAVYRHRRSSATLIGITGSSGK